MREALRLKEGAVYWNGRITKEREGGRGGSRCLNAGEDPGCLVFECRDPAYFRSYVELCFSAMLYAALLKTRGGSVRLRPALVGELSRFREDGRVMRRVSNVLRELRALLGGEYVLREDAIRAARRLFYKYLERVL